jgi:hypothetical protein
MVGNQQHSHAADCAPPTLDDPFCGHFDPFWSSSQLSQIPSVNDWSIPFLGSIGSEDSFNPESSTIMSAEWWCDLLGQEWLAEGAEAQNEISSMN